MRPSRSNALRLEARNAREPGLAPRVRGVHVAVEHQASARRPRPASVPSTLARPSSTCCHWTCSPSARRARACSSRHGLLGAGEAPDVEHPTAVSTRRRGRPSAVAVERHRKCGSTCSPKSRICSCRFVAPELEHDVRAARVAVLLDRLDAVVGRARDRLALVEHRVGHLRLGGEPAAALHRLGDRAGSRPARARRSSSSMSAAPWMF